MSNRPKQLDPTKWDAIMTLDDVMDAVHQQTAMLEAHADNPGACPAVANYEGEFDAVVEVTQRVLDTLAKHAEPLVAEIVLALEQFRHAKLTAITQCTKPTCPDKEKAQQELGFVEGEQLLQ